MLPYKSFVTQVYKQGHKKKKKKKKIDCFLYRHRYVSLNVQVILIIHCLFVSIKSK